MTDFPRTVNNQPGRAVPGDFYGTNPRATVLQANAQGSAAAAGLPALAPVTVGNFAWQDTTTVSPTYVAGAPVGFVGRAMQAVITTFLAGDTMAILQGLPVTLFDQGTFWAKFAAGATAGQAVYADPSTGAPIAGATTPNAASVTADAGFGGTGTIGFLGTGAMGASFTGVIATNVLTASAVTGYIAQGDVLSGSGINPGTLIGAQLTGSAGGAGTYTVTHADISSEAMVASSLTLRVSAVTRGLLEVGNALTGTGLTGASIVSIDTGTGGVGTYTLTGSAQRVASTATISAVQTTMTIASVAQGALQVGSVLSGSGVTTATVVSFGTGTGGVGTYVVSVAQNVASTTISGTTTVLNVTAVGAGALGIGSLLSGSGVTSGTVITAQLSGTTGGVGTYSIYPAQVFSSTTVTELAIPTGYYVQSTCSAGELAKISSW